MDLVKGSVVDPPVVQKLLEIDDTFYSIDESFRAKDNRKLWLLVNGRLRV